MPEKETRICDDCDTEIGKEETKCPKCGADLAEQDELASAVERGMTIAEKRKKRLAPPEPPPQPTTVTSRLRGLGKIVKKG